jgi:hypothetical protein
LKSELFTYDIDEKALGLAKQNDGKLLLITNAQDLTPQEVELCSKVVDEQLMEAAYS